MDSRGSAPALHQLTIRNLATSADIRRFLLSSRAPLCCRVSNRPPEAGRGATSKSQLSSKCFSDETIRAMERASTPLLLRLVSELQNGQR